jgi:uncharacterized repeat protein (TIGR03837 family)
MRPMRIARRWDVFCRVVDNYGDIGFAWRLAGDLASRGRHVRLWADDASALGWMAPSGMAGVEVLAWHGDEAPGDVAVETFGCGLPPRFLRRMADADPPPAWIDVQYLSAETYVERSHGLPSPVRVGEGRWLTRRFFFPGYTPRTGGLLREPRLVAERRSFDRAAWLAAAGIAAQPGERLVSVFCYEGAALPALPGALSDAPTLLLAAPGAAAAGISALLGPALRRGHLRAQMLPWLAQPDYDRLLWSCDLNFVRGEDSLVRAQWAGVPFVWQPYAQQGGAHAVKLEAFLDRLLEGAETPMAAAVRRFWRGWNGLADAPAGLPPLPSLPTWIFQVQAWREKLWAQPDLTTQLIDFVAAATPRPADRVPPAG